MCLTFLVVLFGPLFHVSRKYAYLRTVMAVKTHLPEILVLRQFVEKRFGHPIESRSDFSLLAIEIERVTHEHIAENTLRRLWGKISGYDTVFTRTLDVLCRYVGCEHWNAFVVSLHKQSSRESDVISDGASIKVEDLAPGDRIRIGWLALCFMCQENMRTFAPLWQ